MEFQQKYASLHPKLQKSVNLWTEILIWGTVEVSSQLSSDVINIFPLWTMRDPSNKIVYLEKLVSTTRMLK